MKRNELSLQLLLEDSEQPHPNDIASFRIDRRSFLFASGAAYLASVSPASADDLVVSRERRAFRFSHGGQDWLVDPDAFGPGATAEYRWVDALGNYRTGLPHASEEHAVIAHEIELKHAFFPGFSIRADCKAQLYRRANQWQLRIGFFEAGGIAFEISFAAWISADDARKEVYQHLYRGEPIVVGNINNKENRIEVGRNFLIEIDRQFTLWLKHPSRPGTLHFTSRRFRFGASALKLYLSSRPGDPVPDGAVGPFSDLMFEDARFRHGKAELGAVGEGLSAHLEYDDCAAKLVGFYLRGTTPARGDALLRLAGDGTLVVTGPGTGVIGARIQLERWRVVARASGLDHSARLAGWLTRRAQAIEGDTASVVVQGEGYSTTRLDLDVQFGSGSPARIAFTTRLLGGHVPIAGASTADLTFHRRAVRVVLGRAEADNTTPASARQDALFHIGSGRTFFETRLDDADLRVKRSTDLLDLTFSFRRYALKVERATSRLIRRVAYPPTSDADDRPLLIVRFHPQYLLEEAFAEAGGSGCDAIPVKLADDKYCYPDPGRRNINELDEGELARTRLSAPSRIVFFDSSPAPADGEPMTVEYLTDWKQLATVVNKRALPRTATLDDQLAVAGINSLTTREDAKEMIVANTEAPGPEETAIEPVYRLIVSPDKNAKWKTRRGAPDPRAPVVWSTELENPDASAVRVLWSRDMELKFLDVDGNLGVPPADFKVPPRFNASLDRLDRTELTAMMSVYGIAAMRRLAVKPADPNNPNTPVKSTATDDPNGMVFLPATPYCALDPTEKAAEDDPTVVARQEGFMLARPFDLFNLRLERAATLEARWIGEPPAPWPGLDGKPIKRFFSPAFRIEKYIHRLQEGRDTFVEVTYKGFLLPFGHRAALLKVTKREFWPERNREDGPPTAYLIQRRYIVVRNPDKLYPAYAQPFGSRDFPVRKVTIKTVRTPDLADPEPISALSDPIPIDACRPLGKNGSVFWPQLTDSKPNMRHDVLFEYTFDDGAKRQSPLLFVDNAAAHDAPSMQSIVYYYNNTLPKADLLAGDPNPNDDCFLRFAKLFEAPQRYADEIENGECTFKTASWVLGVRGRLSSDPSVGETQAFSMDAFMEGRDQPAFYPIATKARITADKVDRLTGVPNTAIEAGFDPVYVRHGFDPASNPSSIFLDVLAPDIQFDPAGNTSSTGGIANTNSLLVALARKTGLIGGTRNGDANPSDGCSPRTDTWVCTPPPPAPPAPAPAAAGLPAAAPAVLLRAASPTPPPALQPEPTPYNMGSALAGRFDPVEFFGGAVKDAKLLGVVPLKEILRAVLIAAAPKLMEAASYGAAAAAEAIGPVLNKIRDIGVEKGPVIASAIDSVQSLANSKLEELGGSGMTLAALYPEFAAALERTKVTSSKFTSLKGIDFENPANQTEANIDRVYRLASEFKNDVETVVNQAERLARDPIPAPVREQLAALQEAWDTLRKLFDNPEEALKQFIEELVGPHKLLEHICDELISNELFETVFGYLDEPTVAFGTFLDPAPRVAPTKDQLRQRCKQMLENPADVLPRLQQALFYEVFAEPFAKVLSAAQRLQQEASGLITWGRAALAQRITAILRRGVAEAQAAGLPTYAWKVLEDLQTAVPAIVVGQPLDAIGPRLEEAARQSVTRQLNALRTDIKTWQTDARNEAANFLKEAQKKAREQINQTVEDEYQALMARWAFFKKLADAYTNLARAYGAILGEEDKIIGWRSLTEAELKTIARELRDAAEQEIRATVADFEAQLRERAKAEAEGLAKRLMTIVEGVIDTATQSAIATSIAGLGKDLTDLCGALQNEAYAFIRTFAVGLVHKADAISDRAKEITGQLERITDQLNHLQIPPGAPQDAREVVIGLRASLTRSLQQLAGALLEFEKIRNVLLETPTSGQLTEFCAKPGQLLDFAARSVELRRRAGQAIIDSLNYVTAGIDALPRLAAAGAGTSGTGGTFLRSLRASSGDLTDSLSQLASVLGSLVVEVTSVFAVSNGGSAWTNLQTKATDLANRLRTGATRAEQAAQAVEGALAPFVALADPNHAIRKQIKSNYTPAEALKLANDIVQFTVAYERRLAGVLLQAAQPIQAVQETVFKHGAKALVFVTDTLIPIHEDVDEAITAVLEVITPSSGTPYAPLLNIIATQTVQDLRNAQAAVQSDRGLLADIHAKASATPLVPEAVADATVKLKDTWSSKRPGIIQALQVAKNVVDAIATGNFARLFDVAALKKQLLDAVAELVPTRVTLSYDFDTELSDFPSGNPIFAMNRESLSLPSEGDEFVRNDLDLRTRISLDLLTGDRRVSAKGFIRPFRLHLLGSSLDLVTIYFKGARFEASPGSDTRFNAEIEDVKIGAMLAFLETIQSFLSPGGGNGFYRKIQLLPPQIEVGYRFSKDLLNLGGLIFHNIAFGIAAILPIDGRQAEFRAFLASRPKPFLISAPPPTPYGGGGFIGLRANARGVVAFEIQLEFGAIFGLEFGILYVHARITAGMYLLCGTGGRRVFEGFVQAVGEGNIACFSLSVLIQIKTTQQSDSSMSGSSTYSFSFKVGMFEVTYAVTAGHRTEGSRSGQSNQDVARLDLNPSLLTAHAAATKPAKKIKRKVRTVTPGMQSNWGEYRKHFDI